ncbi:PREDICTED: E3 ubiquitin-protein ligase UPL1-like [Camelina sativa]|uniref:HECT-type E3 ubiquitin transferase n=2 Tax=Camelina sativa TaxID=90675 RepID=A0ABM1QV75_CAMSA|nr:PREDICTED: E3 ubiquitin-protein ligase UPL1-like [Camelina sativa]
MAAGRSSSMPSRLRQLLSGEGSIGPSIRLDAEPPPDIKSFIDKVIQSPLSDIAIPLSGFRWEYSKGNFHHWRPLFLHFDKYFKTFLSNRNDLLLSDKMLEDEDPFPKHTVLQILRAMQIILENSPNKSSFDGLEHFKLLLASTDPEVLIAALETLSALVKISPSKLHRSGKLIGCGSVNSFLLSIAQGWGSKEEGLGLYSCVVANEKNQDEGLSLFPSDLENNQSEADYRIGSTVYFELRGHAQSIDDGRSASSSSRVIHIPDLHMRKEEDLAIMKQCIELHNVPPELRFSLLTRIRYAHAFRSSRICRLYSRICLLAFIVLVQSSDAQDELASFFANEPEYTNELIRIVRSEEPIPGTIRTLAMLALGAQLAVYSASHDRARILSGSSISFAVGNRMILLNVLQKAVLSLKISSDPSSIAFVEALLQFYLLHIVSSSSSGSTIRGSGMVPTFLPLLEYADPSHMHLVYLAVKALQKLMDYSSSAVPLLRDLGGVELLSQRLEVEVHHILGLHVENNSDMVVGESLKINGDQLLSRKRLIKVLLKSLGSATYTPGNANRSQSSHESTLPATLSLIYRNADKFGGDIYYSAVTVMSDIIHKDPTSLTSLFEMGLPEAFLSSVVSGILPSSKALACIPNGLGAICLNSKGLETVKETSALRFLVDVFTSKKYVLAMNEAIVPFTNAVEELLRHVTSLRATGVEIIIEIVDKIACFGETGSSSSSVNLTESTAMEMDSDVKETSGVSHEQFIQLCIFHLIILLHRTMENSETSRLFVEKSGIEALLKLLLRPSIAQSSEGISIALHSTIVFKGFTQHHSSSLARAFCSSLRDQLKKALEGLQDLSGTFLLDRKLSPSSGIFASLFLVEFLLFLAASKDNRWVSALLLEFANGSKDVLENIGHLHREILWQLAFHEGATLESQNEKTGSSPESEQAELVVTATEGQRFNSFRQFLDPSFRRRTAGWSAESQFFDLINLYRDLGRASTGFQPRPVTDGPSSSSDVSGNREHEKDGSYYTSCCDMVRSLSFHITYIFQELGKAMLLPSRRREDTINVSPSSKLVASTFASISLDHLNFGGHEIVPEASVSTKCRYLGKVVDFIDAILLDRPDSCNPVLINCFYSRGVIQTVLTTFDATSQLLFTINRNRSSPMETDDVKGKQDEKEDADHAWIYGPLASYGKLMDHLVTSSFILSPFTKHLLVQPVESGNIPFPQDAETFVKILQSIVLKAVLPVWTHPQFTECSYDYVTTLISIIKHVYSGVELKNLGGSGSARVTGPPPNETTISTIVEMGFSRSRAEEALRQVGSNSVELAMEWLFSHPEEIPEDDDELARALAMSLGNSESDTKQNVADEAQQQIEAELVSLPPVEELITTCTKLLQMKEPLAFPVRDLLVLICSENNGEHRSGVISCLLSRIRDCCPGFDDTKNNLLSALLHVLALILHEDAGSREVALKAGIVRLVCDVLSKWDSGSIDKEKVKVPKWVTTGFLAIDRLLQVDQKLNTELIEELKKGETSSLTIDESKQEKLQSVFGSPQLIDIDDQKKLIEIACACIRNQLPSETMHAVLQLCSTLTRKHSVAVCFLDCGGVQALLSLPSNSLFPGFDSIAASIIRHVLEDPQTLQQAMESEIKHALATLSNRHSNQRISPRNFLLNVNSVIARDPVTFIQAARSICQVEMVGERPYIVLVKEKEKSKEKEKDKDKAEKEKSQTSNDEKLVTTPAPGSTKATKVHRKPPQSFIGVLELLLDSICNFIPPPKDDMVEGDSTLADMDIDLASTKGKGKAVAATPDEKEANSQDMSASLAKMVFVLKLLSEMLLMYSSSIHIILRRDAEINSLRGPQQKSSQVGGIFHHILHKFIPYSRVKKEKKSDSDWRQKLASRGNQFLVGASVRSAEARKRIFSDISSIFNDFIDTCNGFRPPANEIQILIDLLSDILSARSPTGSHISSEASATFVDVGLVKSLTRTLEVLDLDNIESPKAVTGIIKVLELVTKEHVHSADSNSKDENANKSVDQIQSGRGDTTVNASQAVERLLGSNHDTMTADHVENFGGSNTYVGSEALTDDMEHDQDLDEGFAPADDDYMQEEAEDARGLENGVGSLGIEFEMHTHSQENLDEEEDEEMSGDEGDEIDEDENDNEEEDEEDNDLEEDDVHHLPHHDTDQDDHELDDDEFEEEVLVEEDEEDEDDEDRVILRFEDGINGLNVLDHLEVLRDHRFSDETLHVMPVEVFGSRRQGRTTSIYSLLGRTGDGATPSQHPLLSGSASLPASQSQTENMRDHIDGGRDSHSSSASRLDAIFRSLRNGRQGHRLNLWADDSQQIVGSGASTVPQGLEDLLVSQLRRPSSDKPSDQNSSLEPQSQAESGRSQEATIGPEIPAENTTDNGGANVSAPSVVLDASARPDTQATANDSVSSSQSQSVEMQYDQNDSTVRDVEAVSQESGGSGATLGESLRSLDVEIGSADGHDDGAERPEVQPAMRSRRANLSLVPTSAGREASLYSVTEVSENSGHDAEQDNPPAEQPVNRDASSIDPAFLDALPEELRAEVLSAQQGQVPQPSSSEPNNSGDIDPEFLAALPPDIRAEVLAQQQAQRLHQSQELEGQPVEMDTVSIIATFPSELREEVLLTSSDAILANLTPALVAEANMLRERFAHRYHNRSTMFGMHPRLRRGEPSRRGEGVLSGIERNEGVASRRSAAKVIETDGAPLVNTEALQAMIRVLRIVQPLYKGPLQRLLLNLCSHGETRFSLVNTFMDMLMLDTRKPVNYSSVSEPAYRLYACQSNVTYSRPQHFDGVPPLVSRRVLETLTYLARNHMYVAKILLQSRLQLPSLQGSAPSDKAHGKAVVVSDDYMGRKEHEPESIAFALLLSLLNQPLYLRSVAHLEQLLNLLEVIIDNAERKSDTADRSDGSASQQQSTPQGLEVENNSENHDIISGSTDTITKPIDSSASSSTRAESECDVQSVLLNLPQAELCLLCSLLAREGLSDNAYTLVAEVLKKLVAIAPSHCHLFITELANAIQNLTRTAMSELHMFGEAVKALLSTTSSDGSAILRVLQALSSLIGSLITKGKNQPQNSEEHLAVLSQLSNINSALEPLWLELSNCICKIEVHSESSTITISPSLSSTTRVAGVSQSLPAGAQNILPYIESFFVTCEKLHPSQSGSGHDFGVPMASEVEEQPKGPGPSSKVDEKYASFIRFSERHRKLLNAFIRQNPALLEKSFSLMLKVPRFIEFDNKRAYFRSKIKHQHDHHHSPLRISVRRAYILEDSYNQLRMRTTQELKGRLTVHFQGEEGIDAGGLTREWYQLLSRVIFDKGALLFTTVGNDSTFQPNPNSVYQTEHLSYFKFVGRVVGKALFDGQLLDVHFTRSFYKHILGVKVTYHDIEAIDPDYYKNLKWMLEHDISDVLDLTFSIDADEEKLILYEKTEVTDHELIPGGRNIKVTEENKHQYVDLVAEHRLTTAIRPQINAFLEGFSELILRDLISIFNDKELELLISGLPDIDLDDLRVNTEYSGYSPGSPVIQWFWEVVQGLSKEDKARLLQFVTGTSKVPLEGFSALQGISGAQKFQIHKAYGSANHLPSAHTCFNQLDLPEYPSKEHLQERLLLAIHEASEGFGFG